MDIDVGDVSVIKWSTAQVPSSFTPPCHLHSQTLLNDDADFDPALIVRFEEASGKLPASSIAIRCRFPDDPTGT